MDDQLTTLLEYLRRKKWTDKGYRVIRKYIIEAKRRDHHGWRAMDYASDRDVEKVWQQLRQLRYTNPDHRYRISRRDYYVLVHARLRQHMVWPDNYEPKDTKEVYSSYRLLHEYPKGPPASD